MRYHRERKMIRKLDLSVINRKYIISSQKLFIIHPIVLKENNIDSLRRGKLERLIIRSININQER